ncbi:Glucosidase II beta subunit-like, putative [Trypanosoma equiperdum]|uniref:Glucosidase II beta subunit-like, putative n=1 Tax=Trypanosoma equiperdum TaxID=5694 RepID=A0A1G4IKR0_TRYEQ|nr:Glucosidase II beta subunit-like, putative [Trypanosoma equiperdum]
MRERNASVSRHPDGKHSNERRNPEKDFSIPSRESECGALFWIAAAVVVAALSCTSVLVSTSTKPSSERRRERREDAVAHKGAQLAPPPPQGVTYYEGKASPTQKEQRAGEWSCYTMEEYSLKFIGGLREMRHSSLRSKNQSGPQYFFRCGIRIIDTETEQNHTKVKQCAAAAHGETSFPTLRVYLSSGMEERLHKKQKKNFAAQHILLERLNDDYCDCLDGTDELTTNACSMSGVVAPLARKRWRQFLTSNEHVRLYEDEEMMSKEHAERLLTRVGGRVLPFRCKNDQGVLLTPSMMNDGIVDCCDGSDEVDQVRRDEWATRVGQLEPLLDKSSGPESNLRVGDHNTVAQMLMRTGQNGLMTCDRMKRERLREAKALYTLVERGHATWKERVADGWEKYGSEFLDRRVEVQRKFNDTAALFTEVRTRIKKRMQELGVQTPLAPGVPHQEVQRAEELAATLGRLNMQLRHMQLVLDLGVLGDSFEYSVIASRSYSVAQQRLWNPIQGRSTHTQQQLYDEGQYDGNSPVGTSPENLPLHVDNVSFTGFSVDPFAHINGWVRVMDKGKRARLYGDENSLNDNATGNSTSADIDSEPIVIGFWVPLPASPLTSQMSSINPPTGDGALWRRLFSTKLAPSKGGFDKILSERQIGKKRLRELGDKQPHGAPSEPVVHVFSGGIPCQDNGAAEPMYSHGWLVFVCADTDGVLEWHRNGKCEHQIVFGTTSACSVRVMEEAATRLQHAEASVRESINPRREVGE